MEMGFPEDVCKEAIERYDGDENLTNLAKVILIEHKRSLQLTNTQDSSISSTIFTPTESTSRRDSVRNLILIFYKIGLLNPDIVNRVHS